MPASGIPWGVYCHPFPLYKIKNQNEVFYGFIGQR